MSVLTRTPHEAALAFLLERIDYERRAPLSYGEVNFKLDRMRELLDRAGRPQAGLRIIHVAGTKGKGSTAGMIATVLSAAGYRTGLFSSPHLYRVEERLQIDGRPASAGELVELVRRLRPHVEAMDHSAAQTPGEFGPTYFEITTALALLHFARARADTAVLEVGMGGRLDSTNVCQPVVAVISSISFDHTRQLGSTLGAIAREKGGIIKPGIPVVSGVTQPEPREVIRALAAQRESRLIELGRDFDFNYEPPTALESSPRLGRINYRALGTAKNGDQQHLAIGLVGRHQGANAAVALATLGELAAGGWGISNWALRQGLASVLCPARVEVVARRPVVVLDAAHNVASAEALRQTLEESFAVARRLLVFATTQEKDAEGMLRVLLPSFDETVLTRYTANPRGMPAEELARTAARLGAAAYHVCPDPAAAWEYVSCVAEPRDLICVAGSFFLAADVRVEIDRRPLAAPADRARPVA